MPSDTLERAYDTATGHCLDAMQFLRHLSGVEAIESLKAAIRTIEDRRRRKRRFWWGDTSNDDGLSDGFAWLLNAENKDEDAHATIYKDFKQYGDDLFHWTASLAEPTERGFIPDHEDVNGTAETMDQAKRQCERALGLGVCPQHPRRSGKLF